MCCAAWAGIARLPIVGQQPAHASCYIRYTETSIVLVTLNGACSDLSWQHTRITALGVSGYTHELVRHSCVHSCARETRLTTILREIAAKQQQLLWYGTEHMIMAAML